MAKQQHSSSLLIRRVGCAFGILALFLFVSQGISQGAPAAAVATAYVRVVHAAPAVGSTDVFVDGKRMLSNVVFGSVSSYQPIADGTHVVKVAPVGKGINAAIITQSVTTRGSNVYTVATIGTTTSALGLQTFSDDHTITGGKSKVRFYHLSPDAGSVNVATGGKTVISGLTYRNASNYLPLAPGSYTFNVTPTNAMKALPVSVTVGKNAVVSVFAVGLSKGTPGLRFVVNSVSGQALTSTTTAAVGRIS